MSLALCTPAGRRSETAAPVKSATDLREELVLENLPLVKFLAQRFQTRLPPSIDIDDLISAGVIGLMDAAEKFQPERGLKFSTYARQRINGAILDYLRDLDWAPRSLRRKGRDLRSATEKLECEMGRPACDEEVAAEMNISLNQYYQIVGDLKGVAIGTFEAPVDRKDSGNTEITDTVDLVADAEENNPYHQYERNELREQLTAAINQLNEKQRMVMSLYYYEELSMSEIAEILNVNESRISQIHSQAVSILRNRLRKMGRKVTIKKAS